MKILSVTYVLVFFRLIVFAQIGQPVKWAYAAKKFSDKEAVISIKATIDKGWHIYSQNIEEGGPVKTIFSFTPASTYSLIGKISEPKPVTRFEKSFGMEVSYFVNMVVFQQKIRLIKSKTIVNGSLEFMTCNDRKCLPPSNINFSVSIK